MTIEHESDICIDWVDQDPSTRPIDPLDPLPDRCPRCGTDTYHGFGLAGGGMGQYVVCLNAECDFMSKVAVEDDEA